MNVLIIEDEKYARKRLIELLKTIDKNIVVIDTLETIEESVNWFTANNEPDLIFMDIELDDGICFEIFEAVKIHIPIVFTTAYDEYAIRAFKVNSVDYLLKPVDIDDLRNALLKFKRINSYDSNKIRIVLNELMTEYKSRFLVKIGNKYKSIPISNISCFFVQSNNTFLRTLEGKNYGIDNSLDYIEKIVNPTNFFRINRNFIINIDAITEFHKYSTSKYFLQIINQEKNVVLQISRSKITEFKKWIDK